MYSICSAFSECTYFYISKKINSYTFLLVFKIVESLQCILNQKNKVERLFQGPAFLRQNQNTWNVIKAIPELSMNDPEVKKQFVANVVQTNWNGGLLYQGL